MEPVRTCIGSRTRAPRSALVRVVARDGRVVVDTTATLPGRGAWLIPTMDAYDRAVKRKAFRRALRLDCEPDTSAVKAHLLTLDAEQSATATLIQPPVSNIATDKAERLMDN